MLVEEIITLDNLYHPHTLEHYHPECCCGFCLDVSIAKARREQAAFWRDLRRNGRGRLARALWKKQTAILSGLADDFANRLFSEPSSDQTGGLQALLAVE